ncbi:MAG: amidohydrolase [Lachnospiraceae bacterium]|nr:amidohydrolase [Lachnospiraceae bacterium]
MSSIRIYNARILTMDAGTGIIDNGVLTTRDDRIAYLGSSDKEPRERSYDREIDAKGNLLMPGFKNAHTHSGMTFLRSFADDLPLDRWLNEAIFPREARLKDGDIYWCTKLAVMEYLTSGITACFDMYLKPYEIAKATEESGFRCVQVGGMNNFSQSLELQEEWFNELNGKNPLTSYMFGYHAEYTCSKELLEGLSKLAHKYGAPVWGHNSETASEVEGCKERYGLTPTEFADSLGLFDNGGGGYHCVYLSEHDMDIFEKRGLYVATNPGSNTKLASGTAPIARLLERGIGIGIGTDGPASNNCLDMFREMFLTTGLAKLREKDASAVDADKVLEMATAGSARAMGLTEADVLSEGKLADLIMIDLSKPEMRPLNNITKNLVYSGSKADVKLTMVGGKILYEDGRFNIGEDPEVIYNEVDKVIGAMKDI